MQRLLLTCSLLFASLLSWATHFSGGEIYWDCLGNNQYRITLVVYRDCAGINVDPSVTLQLQSPCGNTSLVVSTPGGTEISQLCGAELPNSTCNGGSLPGIQQYIYTGTVTLAPCDSWTISYTNIYRNNAIVNLTNPGTRRTYIRAVVNTTLNPCNNSPEFTNTAIPYVCMGYPITYSFGAFDQEGDSLSYQFIDAMDLNGTSIPYVNPFTGAQPIPGITLDPATGEVNFVLNTQGNWVVVVQVNHWVNGVLVGSVMRDMQFVAYPCGNDPPDPTTGIIQNLSGTAVQLGPRAIQVCESGNFCFDFQISDPNLPNVLSAFSNIQQNLPGATFTYNGFNPINCTVCWTAAPNTSGFFPFIVNVNDGACPIPAFQTYIYSVTVIPGLYGTMNTTNESCVGSGNGTATASVTTGTAPFIYSWNTGATTPSIAAGAGSYTVTITDANNCVSPPINGTIGSSSQPNIANAGPDAVGCVGSFPIALTGNVTNATGGAWSGGNGTYSGTWPTISYTPTAGEIAAGTVTQTLTTTGNGGCPPDSDTMVLTLSNSFANATLSATDAICFGTATGSATFAPALPGFTYAWNTTPVQTGATATGLQAGDYSVVATDAAGCSITLSTTIGPVAAIGIASLTATDETCAGFGDGSATVIATGGTAPYTYNWSTGADTPSITAGAGNYSVSITDANGCAPATGTITISAAAQPNVADAGADLVGCVGSFPIALMGNVTNATSGTWTGGTGSFSGTWPSISYAPSATDLQNNGVTLTLTTVGNNNCPAANDEVFINLPNTFATAVVNATDVSCNNGSSGSATFSPTLPGVSYSWNTTPVQTSATASGLSAGNYTVTATDSFGCTISLSTVVGQPAALVLDNLAVTDETCAGQNNGSITATASGGTAPYTYSWSNGTSGATMNAGAGTYTVTITDANGCAPASGTATIQAAAQPNAADAGTDMVGCIGSFPLALNGTVVNATSGAWSGGNGSFSGTWPTVSYDPSATDIAAGSVTLTLTTVGNNDCPSASDAITITLPNSFANLAISSTDATCFGSTTGTASVTPDNASFDYQWNDPASQTSANATALPAGNWSVVVTDAFGCTAQLSASIAQPNAIVLVGLEVTDETCAGFGNGTVSATVTGGTLPYTYNWSNGGIAASITAGAGTYTVTITDANGCTPATGSATIAATGLPNAANAGPDLVGCLNSYPIALQGSVTNATGGAWSGGAGTFVTPGVNAQYMPTAGEIAAGGVTLTLTTTGNTTCPPASDDVFIALSNAFLGATLTPSNVSCNGAANGSIVFSPAANGNTYQWNDPQAQTTPTAVGLSPGIYTLLVTDALGCDTTYTASISQPPGLVIGNLNTTNVTCNGGANGTANVQVSGGTPNYTIVWSTGQNGATAIALPAGPITVNVTDANGCNAQASATITQPAPLVLTAQVPDTVCVNAPTTLSANATGGTGTLTYNWGSLGTGSPITASFTASQNVQVSVMDQNGCTAPALILPVHVLNLDLAAFNTYGDTTICPGGDAATVGASLSNYAGDHSLSWTELGNTGTGPFTVPFTTDQELHVIATDECGNTIERIINLRVETPPAISLPSLLAEGCAPLTVDFPDLQLPANISYLWNLGNGSTSTSPSPIVVYPGGSYNVSLTVSTPLGCTSSTPSSGSVNAWTPPTASFNASTYQTTADNANIQFTDLSTGTIASWEWVFGDGGTSTASNPSYTYGEVGTFNVDLYVTDIHGCTGETNGTIIVTPVYDVTIPTAFSPNGNGSSGGAYDPNALNNDVFYAFVRFVQDFRMRIFNRWGELIFESDDVRMGWDGYYRNELSPQDVYVVQTWVRFVDGREVQKLTDLTLFR